ncbi:hypothetical protein DXG01_007905 [Tephrocybe rancida]|nr:hypothetical protein DXG01_007905 [Tephrocybe rancida]
MAAPAPSQRPQSSSGPSATWTRSGEPGSAFSGLSSRGGRGRGSGRGRGRGGRGGGAREGKAIGADTTTNTSTSKSTATPIAKPLALPPAEGGEKTPAAPNAPASSRPRGNPRRVSRSIPPVVAPLVNTDAPSNSIASRPANASRRRRSQSGKPAPALPKINVPAHDDNLLRPQRPRMGPVPHTAPIKDAPPHLPGSPFQKRADIDALVERVRAVAMDNRPNTPGSHIDWAGDDDDSLPDLDDWGIPSTKVAANDNGLMSPLGVTGLKPLPGVTIDTEISSPHTRAPELNGDTSIQLHTTPHELETLHHDDGTKNPDVAHVATPITTTQEPLVSAPGSAKVSLHPSLPASTAEVADELAHGAAQPTTSKLGVERGLAASIHSPNANAEEPFSNLRARDGLSASIHAPLPNGISETKSAPSNISSYSTASPEHRTHNRSHTIGRPPMYPPRSENSGRPSRSGYNSPRGGLSVGSGYHTRTHSTPPPGTHNNRSPAHRPVITGDAISRLARTIGTTTLSSAKTSTVGAAHE